MTDNMLRMAHKVEEMVHQAIESLRTQDTAAAQAVVSEDNVVDAMELDIEERCIKLIALQQPLARDLRTIGTSLKIITDLERIADHAVNIAEITLRIGDEPLIKPLIDIPRMSGMAEEMLRHSLDSFVARNVDLAEDVCKSDDPVDDLYSELFDELIGFVLEGGDVRRSSQAINLLFVARYLERIADHATNIAERVIYMVTGKRVAHQLAGHQSEREEEPGVS